jgi:hypothetical protein
MRAASKVAREQAKAVAQTEAGIRQRIDDEAAVLPDTRNRGNVDRLPISSRPLAAVTCAWPRRPGICSYPLQSR